MTKSLLGVTALVALVSLTGCASKPAAVACPALAVAPVISFTLDPAIAAQVSTATLCWADSCQKTLIRLLPHTASVPIACTTTPCPTTSGTSGVVGVPDLSANPRTVTVSLVYARENHVVDQQLPLTPKSVDPGNGCGPRIQPVTVAVGADGKAHAV
jgi:hypothetical protein